MSKHIVLFGKMLFLPRPFFSFFSLFIFLKIFFKSLNALCFTFSLILFSPEWDLIPVELRFKLIF